jgi:signal transduction histidine kinase/DNA-binding NarL/FixJ family response regulator
VPPGWIGFVLVSGITLSGALFLVVRNWEARSQRVAARTAVQEQVERMQISLLRSMEVLHSIAALHSSDSGMDRERFRRFVQPALDRQLELQALSWNPCVSDAGRSTFEAAADLPGFQMKDLDNAGHLIRAHSRPEHVPVYFIEPAAGNAAAVGFDLASDPERLRSLQQARKTGVPFATAPIALAQGAGPGAGLLVVLPVFSDDRASAQATEEGMVDGFAVAVFRVAELVSPAMAGLRERGLFVELVDQATGEELVNHEVESDRRSDSGAAAEAVRFDMAGREWSVRYALTDRFVDGQARNQSWVVLGAGLVFTLATTGYLYGGWRQTRQVAAANAALSEEIQVRQRAEAAAEAANAAKSDFLASMSHEIRTPLNAILGYTQLLQRDPELPADQRNSLSGISASGHHLLELINEILDLAKIEAGRMELTPVDFDLRVLGRSLSATFKLLCVQKRIAFRFQLDGPGNTAVRGDEGKLRQVLINLLGNAVKFTPAGEVFLRFARLPDTRWLFEVVDTGLGIPPEEQAEIFKPFHQGHSIRHQGGTGLGLAIAQRQVALLGGELELQSERAIGSRFHFSLPLEAAESVVDGSTRFVRRLADGCSVKALVVDDRASNRAVLSGLLASIGCEVREATTGLETLQEVTEFSPDIVFLDLLMPEMDGLEVAKKIVGGNEQSFRPKIVAHTASALARHREEALAAGCADFIAKPIHAVRLYQCLELHLGVRFLVEERASDTESSDEGLSEGLVLSPEMVSRLTVAAELHSTTALKAGLADLIALGPEAEKLAGNIRHLMKSYDMDGIQRLLSRVGEGEQAR